MSQLHDASPTPAVLEELFRAKATQVEIASSTPAARIASETARLKPEGSEPRLEKGWIGASEWKHRWRECENNHSRLEVLKKMDEQLGVKVVDRKKVRNTLEWKLALASDKRASAIVAKEAGVSPSRVRQLRMDLVAGRLWKKR